MDEACQALEKSVAEHKFGVMHVHNVRQTLANKGVEFDREVRIFDVCNPYRAKQVLETNILISAVLPCSISVFSEGDMTKFAFLKPTVMLDVFGSTELETIAKEVENTVRDIVETAAQG
jgi:uncharacterized protein (DUF302 family)